MQYGQTLEFTIDVRVCLPQYTYHSELISIQDRIMQCLYDRSHRVLSRSCQYGMLLPTVYCFEAHLYVKTWALSTPPPLPATPTPRELTAAPAPPCTPPNPRPSGKKEGHKTNNNRSTRKPGRPSFASLDHHSGHERGLSSQSFKHHTEQNRRQ